MQERIKRIRKSQGLTQQEFADRLGVSRSNIATYETGKCNIGEAVIKLICREFHINETWLRTGEGEMSQPVTRDQAITDFMADILKGEPDFRTKLVSVLARLSEDEWAMLERRARELAGELLAEPSQKEPDPGEPEIKAPNLDDVL